MSSTWWTCGFMRIARRLSKDATTSSILQLIWVVSWILTFVLKLASSVCARLRDVRLAVRHLLSPGCAVF